MPASKKPVAKKAPATTAAPKLVVKKPTKTVASSVPKPAVKPAIKKATSVTKPVATKATPDKAAAAKTATAKATPAKKAVITSAVAKPAVKAGAVKKPAAAKKTAAKNKAAKAGGRNNDDDDIDLSDLEDDLAGEPEAVDETASDKPVEKVKPLRMKISKAKERALMKEFGLETEDLSEEETLSRRANLKALIKMGKPLAI